MSFVAPQSSPRVRLQARPLDCMPRSQRGGQAILTPVENAKTLFQAQTASDEVRGELLGLVLGIQRIDADCTTGACVDTSSETLGDDRVLPLVRAVIQWGLGGAEFTAVCDWMHGLQVAVCSENMTVTGRLDLVDLRPAEERLDPVTCCPSFKVNAGVGYGAPSGYAQLTCPVRLESGSEPVEIRIPAFAKAVMVLPLAGQSVSLTQLGYCNATLVPPLDDCGCAPVPIVNGAESLLVTNTFAGVTIAYVVFLLSF